MRWAVWVNFQRNRFRNGKGPRAKLGGGLTTRRCTGARGENESRGEGRQEGGCVGGAACRINPDCGFQPARLPGSHIVDNAGKTVRNAGRGYLDRLANGQAHGRFAGLEIGGTLSRQTAGDPWVQASTAPT